jgi:thymidylate synthase
MSPSIQTGYEDLVRRVLKHGRRRVNRTGVDTIGVFGEQLRYDLGRGFPLLTSKRVAFRLVAEELAWFLRGETYLATLQSKNVHIWDEWGTSDQCSRFVRPRGELGPIYSHQWRNFGATPRHDPPVSHPWVFNNDGFDQIEQLECDIREVCRNPSASVGRRLILTGWNPRESRSVALPPCHTLAQFYVDHTTEYPTLSCHLYQRSADLFLGVPFNLASYALLTHLLAFNAALEAGDLVVSYGDAHVYVNHLDVVVEQLAREPRPLPELEIDYPLSSEGTPVEPIDLRSLDVAKLRVVGYDPHPAIKGEVAV